MIKTIDQMVTELDSLTDKIYITCVEPLGRIRIDFNTKEDMEVFIQKAYKHFISNGEDQRKSI